MTTLQVVILVLFCLLLVSVPFLILLFNKYEDSDASRWRRKSGLSDDKEKSGEHKDNGLYQRMRSVGGSLSQLFWSIFKIVLVLALLILCAVMVFKLWGYVLTPDDYIITAEDVAQMEDGKSYRDLCDVTWGCRYETLSVSSDEFTEWIMIQDRNDYDTKVFYGNFSESVVAYEVSYADHVPVFTCEIKTGFTLNRECSYRLTQLPAYFRFRSYEGGQTKLDVVVVHKYSDFAKKVGL